MKTNELAISSRDGRTMKAMESCQGRVTRGHRSRSRSPPPAAFAAIWEVRQYDNEDVKADADARGAQGRGAVRPVS